MRWTRRGRSRNLEDRRGQSVRGGRRGAGVSLGGLLFLVVLSFFFGPEVLSLLGPAVMQSGRAPAPAPTSGNAPLETTAAEEELVDFVSFVLDDVQGFWREAYPALGAQYQETQLVLFRDAVQSACGFAQAATGPFYCPGDNKVYLDLGFFGELHRRFGAPGDFAQAYVIAHEVGHHVQTLMGVERQVRDAQRRQPSQKNQIQVRMELQADCLAGAWGASAGERGLLERGDLEEGLRAAAAIGDDAIQERMTGRVRPESFTHGSSEQRMEWFRRGIESGDPRRCDTFGG